MCPVFHRRPLILLQIVQLILFIVDSGCTKHMTGNLSLLCNFVEKYLGTVRFGNDQFAPILGYGDLVQGNITIKRVYYVEDLQGNDLLTGNRGTDLYTISLQETTSSAPICLMAKASPTQAWLWHRRLSHLNFDYINLLSKKDVVIGLPKLKYVKDQLCSSCEVSKAKRSSFKSKTVPSLKGRLNLLHMDLCGPMRVASINGKKYILVIVDDYSRYTWTLFLRSKDETPEVLKDFPEFQRNLQAPVNFCSLTDRWHKDGENLDKMKEKGDPCILVGYSTQSKGYRVYNKRTRLIVESIHLRFDEIKEMPETSVANDTSGLVPQRKKASDYNNPDPAPELQNVSPSADTTVPSQQELDLLFGPLDDEFFNNGTSRVNKSSSPLIIPVPQDTQSPQRILHPTSEPDKLQTNCSYAEENNDNQQNLPSFLYNRSTTKLSLPHAIIWKRVLISKNHLLQLLRMEAVRIFAHMLHTSLFNLSDGRKNSIIMVIEGVGYVAQPDGFVDPDHPNKVYRLRKALYGLK
ncbi:retrovirus-related pol polyprotein from transposon TNT 1-94 [Tanacetum coccineum]